MKAKIKVKELTQGCMPEIIVNGDWIDLRASRHLKGIVILQRIIEE